jgi:phosphoglycolate phosphatase
LIKAAIFDFDGTLANTLPDLKITLNLTRETYGLPPVTEADILVHVNNHMPVYIRRMIPELADEALWDEALERYYAFYDDHYLSETVPYAGIPEILARLKKNGVKLAVMSNKNHSHILKMVDALFPDTFDSVWGTIPEVPAKPNPARAHLIAEEFGMDISEIAFIGDSDVDMLTACNAKAIPVGVAWGYRPADVLRENGAVYTPADSSELYGVLASLA